MGKEFNVGQALQDLRSGKNLLSRDGVLAPLVKQLMEAALHSSYQAELDTHHAEGHKRTA